MKKLLLFAAVASMAFSLNSCEDDEDRAPGLINTATFKFDGVERTYDTGTVFDLGADEGGEAVGVVISSGQGNEMYFDFYKGDTGINVATDVYFVIGNDQVYPSDNFVFTITENVDGHAEGVFSGPVTRSSTSTTHNITEGTFEVNYE